MKYALSFFLLLLCGESWAQLTCNNCSFSGPGGATVTGTTANPAVILASPGTFAGAITLNGNNKPCNFTIIGKGSYTLSGQITGTGPLIYNAPAVDAFRLGFDTGIILAGTTGNDYTGPTTIAGGYVVCNKPNGVAAVPAVPGSVITISATTVKKYAHLWCQGDNQLGTGAIIDFSGAQAYSIIHLNGTTQTIAGLTANNSFAVVKKNYGIINNRFPTGMLIRSAGGTLNIEAGTGNRYIFGGGGYIWTGEVPGSKLLTINSKSGTQVIPNPTGSINNVILASSAGATLEFITSDGGSYSLGGGVTFRGEGVLKKTGSGTVVLANCAVLKSAGEIWASDGILQNGGNTVYSNDTTRNKAILRVEALNGNTPVFDLNGNASLFGGLTGGGFVQNNSYSTSQVGGYSWLTVRQNNLPDNLVFSGIIRDNSSNGEIRSGGLGGVAFRKIGAGTQVLTGGNLYTGSTTVSSGVLKLQGNGVLGATSTGDGSYGGVLEISNVPAETAAVFEHNGSQSQVFTGDITTGDVTNIGSGTFGKYLQSGSGKTIINGSITKNFNGDVSITAGFLGGSGDISKANTVTVGAIGSIGGVYDAAANSAAFIVSNLTFAATASKLIVTSRADNTPSLVDVRTMGTSTTGSGSITAGNGFTVDVLGGPNLVSGYIINCTNGASLPVPTLGNNNTQKPVCFKWDATGLYMTLGSSVVFNQPANITAYISQPQWAIKFTTTGTGLTAPTGYQWKGSGDVVNLKDYTTDWTKTTIPAFTTPVSSTSLKRTIEVTAINSTTGCTAAKTFTYTILVTGLICDNCSFTGPGGETRGTPLNPAVILASPGTTFEGTITLTGACNFTIMGGGNYTLSGQITGIGPLAYHAPYANTFLGLDTGITLTGTTGNNYEGLTTLDAGYIICNKDVGKAAVPGNIKVSSTMYSNTLIGAHLWCQSNYQFGRGTVIDFSDAQYYSFIYLNGTTQTIGGLKANNNMAVVKNNYGAVSGCFPNAITTAQVRSTRGTLDIEAGTDNRYVFGGGGYIWTGEAATAGELLSINIKSGTQAIQNPTSNISNLIFTSSAGATLEFTTSNGSSYSLGGGVTFRGEGALKKTGTGTVVLSNSTVLKSAGEVWVSDGILQNGGNTIYSNDTEKNKATLRVEVLNGNNPVFDLKGNASLFGGLTGGGFVQNNSYSTSQAGGYSWLTVGQNNSPDNLVFSGIIRDNSANAELRSGGLGGVAFRKIGAGTQVLTGGNLYTGSTTVSSGILKLQGNGVLGAGSYGGVLEISNVSSGTAAIFEHNGSQPQVFTGDITTGDVTNIGSGTFGKYIQSGIGKTIINGTIIKNFNGDVSITGGFLGGSGDLSKANTVTVEGGGSIGGGSGETLGGDTFTVSNLTFAALASKLKVTSRADNTPSLVDVRTMGTSITGSGSVTAGNGFTVDVLGGTNLVSGYVMYCTNGASLPAPTLGDNNTGKSVCFKWDATGLWMQLSFGNITLTATSLCPVVTSANLVVTVTATYSDSRDYPPLGAAVSFSLSDPSVKSGDMTITRVPGNTMITATFNGVNQTTSNKSYTVTYSDRQNCIVKIDAAINPQPVLSIISGGNPVCKGTPIVLQATGQGTLTILSADINTSVVSITSSVGLATASTSPLGNVDFFARDGNGCRSGNLSVLVKDLPVMDVIPNQSVCSGAPVVDYTPSSSGVGETKPTHYQWKVAANALNHDNVGLSDYTLDWSKPAISKFTAKNTTTTILKRDVTVSAYNSATGCTSASQVYTITVHPTPVLDAIPNLSVCSGAPVAAYTPSSSGSGESKPTHYQWKVSANAVNTSEVGLLDYTVDWSKSSISSFTATTTSNVLKRDVTVLAYNAGTGCISSSQYTITVHPTPVLDAIPNLSVCSASPVAAYTPSSSGAGESKPTHYQWKVAANAVNTSEVGLLDYTVDWSKSSISSFTATTTSNVLKRDVTVSAYNAISGCSSSSQYTITVHPTPVLDAIPNLSVCSASPVAAYTPSSSGAGESKPTHYQWKVAANAVNTSEVGLVDYTVDWSKSSISSFTATTTSNVLKRNVTVLAYNAGTGCISSSQYTITVHPTPVLDAIPNLSVCSGAPVAAYTPSSSGAGETKPTHYQWKVSANAVNTSEVGLLDYTVDWSKSSISSFTATTTSNVLKRDVTVSAYNAISGCSSSSQYTITVHPTPVLDAIPNLSVCSGAPVAAYTPSSSGSGESKPTHYQWKVSANAVNTSEVGLLDYTVDWSKSSISSFTATTTSNVLKRDVTVLAYNAGTGCISSSQYTITVHPTPVLDAIPNLSVCSASPVAAYTPSSSGAGESKPTHYQWKVAANAVNTSEVGLVDYTVDWSKSSISSFTATTTSNVLKRNVTVLAYNAGTGCISSSQYTITVHPTPVLDAIPNLSVCSGAPVAAYTPSSSGAGETKPTHYQWKVSANAVNTSEVGLLDYTVDWSKSSISSFTATTTSNVLKRDVTVSAYNAISGCSSSSQYTITVHPTPVLDAIPNLSVCSASPVAAYTPSSSGSGETKPTHYQWKVSANAVNTSEVGLLDYTVDWSKSSISSFTATTTSNVLKRDVTVLAYNAISGCISSSQYTITVHPTPVLDAIPNLSVCSGAPVAAYTPSSSGAGESKPTHYQWKVSANAVNTSEVGLLDYTVDWSKSSISSFTATTTSNVLKRDVTVSAYNAGTGCISSSQYTITVHPTPVLDAIPNLSVCSGAPVAAYTPSSSGAGETKPTHYQWKVSANAENTSEVGLLDYTVDWSKSSISSFTATTTSNVLKRDVTVLAYNAGTGCISSSQYTITVHPTPVLDAIPNLSVCSASPVAAYTPSSSGAGESKPTHYQWKVSANAENTSEVGLVDYIVDWSKSSISSFTATTTSSILKRDVTVSAYNAGTGCISSSQYTITVHPTPVLDAIPNLSVCSGAPVAAYTPSSSGAGESKPTHYQWKVSANAVNTSEVGLLDYTVDWSKSSISSFTATTTSNVLKRDVTVLAYNAISGCSSSSQYTITVHPTPVLDAIPNLSVCSGAPVAAYTPSSSGAGETKPTHYQWKVSANAVNTSEVGLLDYTVDWSKSSISSFTATTTSNVLKRDVTVSAYNAISGCISSSQYTITVHPTPVLDAIPNLSVCSGAPVAAYTPSSSGSGESKPTHYQWKVSANAVNTSEVGLLDYTVDWSKSSISNFTATTTSNVLKRDVTVSAYNAISGCSSSLQYTITVHPTPVLDAIPNLSVCSGAPVASYTPSSSGSGETKPTHYQWKVSANAVNTSEVGLLDYTVDWSKSSISSFTATTTSNVLKRDVTVSAYNAISGCISSSQYTITVHPTPVLDAIPNLSVCSGAPVAAYTPSSSGAGETKPTHYQWKVSANAVNTSEVGLVDYIVDWSKSSISSFTATTTSNVLKRDVTVLAYNAISGCISSSQYTITVHPTPVLDAIPNLSVCSASPVASYTPSSSGAGESKPTHYQWKVSANAVNTSDVGLLDYTVDWSKSSISSFTATTTSNVLKRDVTVSAYNAISGCISSSQYTITVHPTPVLDAIPNLSVCSASPVASYTPSSSGSGESKPTHYQWKVSANAVNTSDVGLVDYIVDWSKSSISSFTATTTSNVLKRDVTVSAYNAISGCSSSSQYTITVHPTPVLDAIPNLSVCSASPVASYTPSSSGAGESKPTHYQWKVSANAVNTSDVGLLDYTVDWSKSSISSFTATTTSNVLKRDVTVSAYNAISGCISSSQYTITVHPTPVLDAIPNLSVCSASPVAAYTPSSSGAGETKPTHYQWKVSANAVNTSEVGLLDYTVDWSKSSISSFTATTTSNVLKRDVTVSAYNAISGCISSSQYTITVHPTPVLDAIPNLSVCSGAPVAAYTPSSSGAGETKPTHYQWKVSANAVNTSEVGLLDYTVDWSKSSISSFTATTTSNVLKRDVTVSAYNAISGCSSSSQYTITVHPTPVLDAIPNLSVCSGAPVAAYTPSSSGAGETKPTHYQWKVSANAVNTSEVGLLDYTVDWSKSSISSFTATTTSNVLKRDVTVSAYNAISGCISSSQYTITVHPTPVLDAIPNLSVCSGAPVAAYTPSSSGSGESKPTHYQWKVSANAVNTSEVGLLDYTVDWSKSSISSFTATTTSNVLKRDVTVSAYNAISGCISSSQYTITVHPTPVLDAIPNLSVCSASPVAAYTPSSSGAGETKPTHYQWKVSANAVNTSEVGLLDYTVDWSKSSISSFTATTTSNVLKRDVTVSAYNAISGCISSSQYTITVHPTPVLDAIPNLSVCSGAPVAAYTPSSSGAGETKPTHYQWKVSANAVNTSEVGLLDYTVDWSKSSISSFTATTTSNVLKRDVTVSAYNAISGCISSSQYTITVHPTPVLDAIPNLSVCSASPVAAYTPSSSGAGETKPTHYQWKVSANAVNTSEVGLLDYTVDWSKSSISSFTATTTSNVLKRDVTVSAYNAGTGCISSSQYTITVHPTPVLDAIPNLSVCSGAPVAAYTPSSSGAGETKPTHYQWKVSANAVNTSEVGLLDYTVDWSKSSISSFTATTTSNVLNRDVTVLAYNAISGCSSSSQYTITVHPTPVLDAIPNLSVCSGAPVAAYTPSSSGAGESKPTHYQWKVSANAENTSEVGLLDYTVDWSKSSISSFTATTTSNVLKRDVTVSAYNAISGCSSSSQYTITVHPTPVLDAIPNLSVCSGAPVAAYTPSSSGAGESKPTHYQWKVSANAVNTSEVGLLDYTVDWSKSSISNFTATTTSNVLKRDVTVSAYNAISGCSSSLQYTITVHPTPVLDAIPNLSVCSGAPVASYTPSSSGSGETKPTHYQWKVSANAVNTSEVGLVDYIVDWSKSSISSFTATTTSNVLKRDVMVLAYNAISGCSSSSQYTITVHPTPVLDAIPNLSVCSGAPVAAYTPSSSGAGETKPTHYQWKVSANAVNTSEVGLVDYIVDWSKSSISSFTATTTSNVLKRDVTVSAYNAGTGCISTSQYTITVHPTPVLDAIPNLSVCSASPVAAYTPSSSGAGETKPTHYQWKVSANAVNTSDVGLVDYTVDWSKSSISSFTATTTSNVLKRDVTVLAYNAISGCSSSSQYTITVHPTPVLDAIPNLSVCSASPVAAYTPSSSGAGETKPTHYQWKVSANAVNTSEVGLVDYIVDWSKSSISHFTATTTSNVLKRDVTVLAYNAISGCISSSQYTITVHPTPVLDAIPNLSVCSGAPVAAYTPSSSGAGESKPTHYQWKVSANAVNTSEVGLLDYTVDWSKSSISSFTATTTSNVLKRDVTVLAYNAISGCISSSQYTITVHPTPVLDAIPNLSVCSGAPVAAYTPSSSGAGESKPTHYQWKVSANAVNTSEVGLLDYTVDWSKSSISSFTATTTSNVLKRDVTVSAYNAGTGCISSSQYTITVHPTPVLDAIPNLSVCSGAPVAAYTPSSSGSGETKPTHYQWKVSANAVNTSEVGLLDYTVDWSKSSISSFTATTTSNVLKRDVTVSAYNAISGCSSSSQYTITVHPTPVLDAIPNLSVCSGAPVAAYTPSSSGSGETKPTHYQWKVSANAVNTSEVGLLDYTVDWSKSSISSFTATTTSNVLKRDVTVSAYNAISGCSSSSQYTITVHPTPVLDAIPNLSVCSASPVAAYTPSSSGSGETKPTHYQWKVAANAVNTSEVGLLDYTVDWSKSSISNFTATTTSNVLKRDVTVLAYNAISGCISSSQYTITVHPTPVLDAIPNLSVCSGAPVAAYTPSSSGAGESKPTHYQWKVSANAVNTSEVGLLDYTVDWSKSSISNFTATTTSNVLKRDVTVSAYNAISGCSSSLQYTITVHPTPVLDAIPNLSVCSGAPVASYTPSSSGSGETKPTHYQWKVSANAVNTSEVGLVDYIVDWSKSSISSFTATTTSNVLKRDVMVLAYNAISGCSSSSQYTITVHPTPVLDAIPNLSVCSGAPVAAYTPSSSGAGETKPTHYQWKVSANAVNTSEVGLVDYIVDWSKSSISSFTATTTSNVLKRDVTVLAYNAISGCQAEPQVYTITVNSGPVVTYTATSPICNGLETDVVLRSTLSSTTYTWTVNNNNVGGQSQTMASNTSFIRQTLTNRGSSSETVNYKVIGTIGHCSDTVSIAIEVSNTDPVTPTVEGGGHYCVNPENGTYQTNLIPSLQGRNAEWTYTSYYGSDQLGTGLTGNTQKTERGTLTAVKDNLVLSNTSSASVYYVFRPFSGCYGTPSDPIGIRLYAAPVITAIPSREVCSSSEAYPTAANIALSSSTPDVVYTWAVDKINGRDVSGYSEPSREGARVPTQNPAEAHSGPIADALSLPANAGAQTIDYWVTPWHLGCPGQAVLGRVKVNPLPAITAPADREHCLGDAAIRAAAEPLKGKAAAFTWTGGDKAGLADQTVYGPGLPAYKVASTTTPLAVKVTISGKDDKGCKGSTSFNIAVNPKPSIKLEDVQNLCTGPTIETAAQVNIKVSSPIAGTKYRWKTSFVDFRQDGKSVVQMLNGNNEPVALPVQESPKEEGNFSKKIIATTGSDAQITFRLTPFLGGCAGTTVPAAVRVNGVNLGADIVNNSPYLCSGGTTNIKIGKEGDGNTYNWEGINNSNNVRAYTLSKESAGGTTISDVLTLDNNKRDSVTYRITPRRRFTPGNSDEYYCNGRTVSPTVFVNPIPVLDLSPATASICSGEKTAITPSLNMVPPESNEVYYSWEVTQNTLGARPSSGFQASISQQVLTNDKASESSVTYTITPQYQHGAGGTCKGHPATFTYQVNTSAGASISSVPEAVCLGDKVTLKTDSKGTNFQWLKNGKTISGATGDSYVVPTDSVSVSSYAVRITTNGCGKGTSEARKVKVSADAYFTGGSAAMDKTAAATGEAVKFSYTGPKADYLWDFNDNTPVLNTESVTHSYTKSGTYYPALKATKPGQPACTKTFSFSLEIRSVNPAIVAEYGVFPIPSRDRITISSSEEDDLQNITLSEMSGKMVLNEAVKGHNVTLSVAHIAQGVYLLSITNTKGDVKRLEIAKE